jgi:DNA repair protein RadA/Sms
MGSIEDVKDNIDVIKPEFLIIDSIQTIFSQKKGLISGSVSSLKYITGEIIELAKNKSITVFIIGHITKDGSIAGPKTLEHMVDVVLYFQGELKSDYRILRTEKNRFGPVDEIGVFQMTGKGLISVDDPSQLFIGQRDSTEPGLAVFPADRGTRAILLEIQALVTESPFAGNPRRISVGFDGYRMSMLLSVIEKKLKIPFYKSDVFINITGGMNIKETAGDLAVISALISSHKNIPLPTDTLIIGEVGLTGEIRPVGGIEKRIKEGIRQGYKNFILPEIQAEKLGKNNIKIKSIKNVLELYSIISGQY